MIARAGLCALLSVCIVIVATVILHRAEWDQRRATPTAIAAAPEKPIPKRPPPEPTPGTPWPADSPPSGPPVRQPEPRKPTARRIVRAPTRKPDSPFTRVEKGETLSDVINRVYGGGIDPAALWKMNRDQLDSPTAPLRAGMALRTPEL